MTAALVRGRDARSQLPASPLILAGGHRHTADSLLRAWRESKSPHTIAAYQCDLEEFALFVSRALAISPVLKVADALAWFFRQGTASAHETVLHFRGHLQRAGMAPSSINRHLAALRSLTALGRMLGVIDWRIEVPGVTAERRRDTRGPDPRTVAEVLDACDVSTLQGARDAAIVHVLFGLALRCAELCRLDVSDLDVPQASLWVLGKGQREKVLLTVPEGTLAAIRTYLPFRGPTAGPLFQSVSHRGKHRNHRLETRSVLRIVRAAGQRVGIKLWCHGLRHTAITVAIEQGQQAGVGLDQIRHFSRHKQVATMMFYRDEREQAKTQAQLANIVSSSLSRASQKGGA
jgi:integrase/recombinase XerC